MPNAIPIETEGSLGDAVYRFPATQTQQAFWYLDKLDPGNPAWNIAVRFEIKGSLNAQRLEKALNRIAARHESLRTTFEVNDGEPAQVVHATANIPVPADDLSILPPEHQEVIEEQITLAEAEKSFRLAHGPLLRARLLKLEAARHILLVTVHHIVADGWSIGLLSDELAACYTGDEPLPPLDLQFADYAIWMREQTDTTGGASLAYWQKQLANLPSCDAPADFPRPAVKSHDGSILSVVLAEKLSLRLAAYARERGSTLYVLTLSALQILLSQLTGKSDVYVGTQLAGRERVEFERLIGVFVNTVVLRTQVLPETTFTSLLNDVRHTFEQAVEHGEVPFSQVVATLHAKFDRSRHSLYGINFIYQRDFVKPAEFAGLTMTPMPSKSPGAIYDLNFFMVERGGAWRLSCEYDRQLYTPATVERMLGQIVSIFEQIAEQPDRKCGDFSLVAVQRFF